MTNLRNNRLGGLLAPSVAIAALLVSSAPLSAQDNNEPGAVTPSEFEALKACQSVAEDAARLSCFDQALTQVVAAEESGELQIVDREDMKKTRRQLFGFSLPDIGLFGGDDAENGDELFETTIASARRTGRRQWTFTTAEGAIWRINNAPARLRSIDPGQTAIFKQASLGTFFIRINGQMGIRGKRIG